MLKRLRKVILKKIYIYMTIFEIVVNFFMEVMHIPKCKK